MTNPRANGAAGIARRSLALGIDVFAAALCFVPLFVFGIFDATLFQAPDDWFWTEWWMKFWLEDPMILVIPGLCYLGSTVVAGGLQEWLFQRSVGGRICGLQVTDSLGSPLSGARQVARCLGTLLNVGTVGLGFLWIFVDPHNRGFHDLISRSEVRLSRLSRAP